MKSELNYIDSSQQQSPKNKINKTYQKDQKCQKQVLKHYHDSSPQLYCHKIKQVLESNINKNFLKKLLLIDNNDKQILDSLYKKEQKYKSFIRDMEIDGKYHDILLDKVSKLHQTNLIKKKKHQAIKQQKQMETEKTKLKKYLIEKNLNQHQVINGLEKKVRSLGIDRAYTSYKIIKEGVQKVRQSNQNKFDSLNNKQNNELAELKETLQNIRKSNKFNIIEQNRLLRDYREQIGGMKKQIQNKCDQFYLKKKNEFKI